MRETIRATVARPAAPNDRRTRSWRRTLAGTVAVVAAVGAGTVLLTGAGADPVDAAETRSGPAVVRTDRGTVRGTVAGDHRSFQGIPYAAPPVGELRWQPPRPAARWTGIRDAGRPGPACAQLRGLPMDQPSESEDCLYLNVTTPAARPGRQLPVMVWLHGGHFLFGQGDVYGGRSLATRGDVVVVTVNYRLGPLGFLAHPALDAGPGRPTSGNVGLEDQQAALRWVRDNAAAFGGDSGNVTLFGQSGGATSVCTHLAAPASGGLFHRAIIQSNSCATPLQTRQAAEAQATALVEKLGCVTHPRGTAGCLREKSAADLVAAAGFPGPEHDPGPSAGGTVLPVDPARALATGGFHRVPVLTGTTHDEYRGQVWGMERSGMNCPDGPETGRCELTDEQYPHLVDAFFGDRAAQVNARYPRDDYDSASEALAAIMTDHEYVRPALDADAQFARYVPTYAYEFADDRAPWFRTEPVLSFPPGAYHLADLPYLFDVGYAEPLRAQQRQLADQMIGYWTRFARTGDPNGAGSPDWARFRLDSRYVQSLAPGPDGIRRTDLARDHRYDFWRAMD
ncbi:carboxylesterase/lipase family protein [Plantactinospora soyae]|uniref:Carboxylic ester hydrolase n=1 Tax=Plantactinospora soyae TaxID=1544732 RepID=A0A927M6F1_9ACTN|nr:carboxylesterase/lipase family protein [Plantactinospora soyae]MBE1488599.1 para-nitrobenzyl esterase [Plantactinospora soyae]